METPRHFIPKSGGSRSP